MKVTNSRFDSTASEITPIRDPDYLAYRDLLMLEQRLRHGLSCRQIGRLYRLDHSVVSKRLAAVPAAVVVQMRAYIDESIRSGEIGLGEDGITALQSLMRPNRKAKGARRGVA